MTAVWTPSADLVDDARRAISAGPAADPAARFEQLAWAALLGSIGPLLLTRHYAPLHLTASAAVLDPSGEQTCLVFHHKLELWVQPGGHLEDGDVSVAAAAAREVEEETGLSGELLPRPALLSRHRAPCQPQIVDWHLDVQYALIAEPAAPRPSAETPSVAWWPVGELPPDLAPGVDVLIRSAIRLLRGSTAHA